jgi:hypothetical protein
VGDEAGGGDRAEPERPGDDGPPLTATEAFLRSAHIDHGDPPLPPMDDAEVGARYARDAMRATARAQAAREEESRPETAERGGGRNGEERDEREPSDDEGPDADRAEATGKPLGWLFRSSS